MKTQDKIRAIRTQQKISQEQMAERLDLTPQAYSKIESGKTKLNLDRIQQIAHILNIDITELINDERDIFLLVNENGTNHGKTIYHNNELIHENEKLQLIISHQNEIINQLKSENHTLKEMIALLKSNNWPLTFHTNPTFDEFLIKLRLIFLVERLIKLGLNNFRNTIIYFKNTTYHLLQIVV